MRYTYNESYKQTMQSNLNVEKEVIKVHQLKLNDVITLGGYTFTITKIEDKQLNKWSTPRKVLTGYSNIDDTRKEYKISFSIGEYVTLIKNYNKTGILLD